MTDPRQELRFAPEPVQCLGIDPARQDQLERDTPVQLRIESLVDDSHSPTAQLADQPVATDPLDHSAAPSAGLQGS